MNNDIHNFVKRSLNATEVYGDEPMQDLWGGQGQIIRVRTDRPEYSSVVLKVIRPASQAAHPRGWNSNASYLRKLESYRVEANFYSHYAHRSTQARVAALLGLLASDTETLILLEDLSPQYPDSGIGANHQKTRLCLQWLAQFHAQFLGDEGQGLWPQGCYWHLATRQDEFAAMADGPIKQLAKSLDKQLCSARFKTLVHGDAKVANFCFANDLSSVAAVDFQYIGQGCGIRDVAYLLGSCLTETECLQGADALVDHYFNHLQLSLKSKLNKHDRDALEVEWRSLYSVAWTDFYRFLLGWMPEHTKINAYTKRLARQLISQSSRA